MYSTLSRPLQPSCAVKCCTPSTNICRYVCCYSSPPCPVARPKPGLCIGLTNSGTSPPLVASQHRTAHCDRVNAKQSLCMRSTAGVQQRQAQTSGAGSKSFTYTAYEGNSWQITLDQSGVTVLVDPWLEGDLVFANQTWLYRGKKGALNDVKLDLDQIGSDTDVILLSQGLDDHAHKPTLERLPKDKQVVGSLAAAAVAESLGFTNVIGLDHGKTVQICGGKLNVTATAGALVGPPWSKRENGFVLSEACSDGIKLYYEPHCDYDESAVAKIGKVDVMVTPANSQVLIKFPLVKGKENAVKLVETLQPSIVIPLINAQFHQSGPLSKLIHAEGSPDDLEEQLRQHGMKNVSVRMPAAPGKALSMAL